MRFRFWFLDFLEKTMMFCFIMSCVALFGILVYILCLWNSDFGVTIGVICGPLLLFLLLKIRITP